MRPLNKGRVPLIQEGLRLTERLGWDLGWVTSPGKIFPRKTRRELQEAMGFSLIQKEFLARHFFGGNRTGKGVTLTRLEKVWGRGLFNSLPKKKSLLRRALIKGFCRFPRTSTFEKGILSLTPNLEKMPGTDFEFSTGGPQGLSKGWHLPQGAASRSGGTVGTPPAKFWGTAEFVTPRLWGKRGPPTPILGGLGTLLALNALSVGANGRRVYLLLSRGAQPGRSSNPVLGRERAHQAYAVKPDGGNESEGDPTRPPHKKLAPKRSPGGLGAHPATSRADRLHR